MARRFYSSTAARTTLAAGVDGTQTTMSVTAVSGWPTSFPYTLVIDQDTVNEELVEVTGRTGTTITVTRGIDGTSGTSHDAGAVVQHGVSARDFDEPNAFINGTGTVTETLLATGAVTEAKLGTGAVTSAKILDGTIVNADINASAAIAQSKIADLTSDLASKPTKSSGTTAPASPTTGDLWYDTNTTPPTAKFYDGTSWQTFSAGAADFSNAATGTYTDTGVEYKYLTFTASGTLTVTKAGLIDVLVVGGGGPGGRVAVYSGSGTWRNGGGGAGGYVAGTYYLEAATYTVTVGAGGSGSGEGVAGSDSRLGNIGAAGGGRGSLSRLVSGNVVGYTFKGGSGGGGMSVIITPTNVGAPGVLTQGNAGASGSGVNYDGGGGGGGASAAGSAPSGTTGGAGGAGTAGSITGTSVTRGGGGGGAGATGGAGGTGGGGAGTSSGNGGNGSANTGGGGGGCSSPNDTNNGGNGGSGVVIVRVRT